MNNISFLESSLNQIIKSILLINVTFLIRRIFISFSYKKLYFIGLKKFDNLFKDIVYLNKPISYLIILTGSYFSIISLNLSNEIKLILKRLFKTSTIILFIWILIIIIDKFLKPIAKNKAIKNKSLINLIPFVIKCTKIFFFVVGLIMIMENLGYSTSSIIAAFGIGSAAIAFASQDTIANFFGSLSLVLDQPFQIGDRIRLSNDIDGFVESIGIRSTRIRTLSESILTIPNRILANEKIDNWTRLKKRQVKQIIGINYSTNHEVIKKIIEEINLLLNQEKEIHKNDIIVRFFDFGKSSLDILVIYYTNTPEFNKYLTIRQAINIEIIKIINQYSNIVTPKNK